MKKSCALIFLLIVFGVIFLTLSGGCSLPQKKPATEQIKTPHFLDSFPENKQTYTQTPELVKINFDFDLDKRSNIKVFLDGNDKNVADGPTKIAQNNLSMEVKLKDSGKGTYIVKYTAYWPDGSSHDGRFIFYVDPETISMYQNLTGKKSVLIELKNTEIIPQNVIIRKGTTATWVNMDDATHFINSDPHASHNVLKSLNSRGLAKGETYSYTFNQNGEWAYHCSAHYPQGMVARIIVK